jgi:phosphotransferase system enzyme I (PtsP)
MGVPILRGGQVIGVLVIQNRTFRDYAEEELETLETVAMVLAELVAGGELISPDELLPTEAASLQPLRLDGIRLNEGIAIGRAVLHQPRITIGQMIAENPAAELDRLKEALASMQRALDDMIATHDVAASGETREILETYRMFAEDHGWMQRMTEAIQTGLTAEAAVQRVQDETRRRMAQITDPYLRERLSDLEDLTNRLLRHLTGERSAARLADLPDDMVLVAHSMGPAELLDYDRRRLRAIVLEEGAPSSHVAIMARALDIPMVGRVKDAVQFEALCPLIVDADSGHVIVRPGEEVRAPYLAAIAQRAERARALADLRDLPATTRDGATIALHLNAGLLIDLSYLDETGADGIGLYRTEIPFMIRESLPDVAAQVDLYRRVLARAGSRRVVFRTLDVGGDKLLPYLREQGEDNPALGWRAIRLSLDRPILLRQQLRALIRASSNRPLDVMFPMIAEIAEFEAARDLLDLELKSERRRGQDLPSDVRVGTMLEVPALFWQLPALCGRLDFVSVGSNDLFQFLFASDRGNPRLADRYDVLAPAVLSFLRAVVSVCARARVPLTLCGEMGGRPVEAMALIGLGFRSLSMTAGAIAPVKAMIRALEVGPLESYLASLMNSPAHTLRPHLRAFARDHGIPL